MRVRRRLIGGLGAVLTLACTETPYSFFQSSQPPASGGSVATGGQVSGSGGSGSSGGTVGVGGESSGGSLGQGGEAADDACESIVDATRMAVQLRTSSGRCVSAGDYAPLLGEDAFAVVLRACEGGIAQRWTLEEMEYGAVVFASETVQLNLDVRYASSDDGTPVVLYTPHRLYNQRFVQRSGEAGTFKLQPLHTPDKCLSERGDALELWPCDPAVADQIFEIIACDAMSP